ncbi:MAG: response regulator, partial [Planctomycetota bacterium]|nr:response regulator [Planctomycetota bacterium]
TSLWYFNCIPWQESSAYIVYFCSIMRAETPSILITDNDQQFRDTILEVLRPTGYRTLEAIDGMEAMQIVQEQEVHVVLLDMHMPRQNGLETLKRLKIFKAMLPCILLSAEMDERLEREARRAQAFEVLRKPVTRTDLTGAIEQALHATYGIG